MKNNGAKRPKKTGDYTMKKRRIAPSERMKQGLMEGLVSEADPLGEAARRGAQLILQRALEAEVSDFLRVVSRVFSKKENHGRDSE